MGALQWSIVGVGSVLELLVLSALLRGPGRRFPFLFAYVLTSVLSTVLSAAVVLDDGGRFTSETAKVYWALDGFQHLLLFLCLLHMLWQVTEQAGQRRYLAYIAFGALLFAALSTWQAYDPRLSYWMTQLARNTSFGSMLLTLTLWTVLIRRPHRLTLLITAAIGVHLACNAIGHSLRQMAKVLVLPGNLVLAGGFLACFYILYRALRAEAKTAAATLAHSESARAAVGPTDDSSLAK